MSRKYKFHNEAGAYFISFFHDLIICFVGFMHPLVEKHEQDTRASGDLSFKRTRITHGSKIIVIYDESNTLIRC